MVSNKKQLHLASNLEQLMEKADFKSLPSYKKDANKLVTGLKKLNEALQDSLIKPEQDEELIYLITFRMMSLWQVLEHTEEFKSDSKYYKLLIGKEISKAFKKMEEVNSSLEKRYEIEFKKDSIPERRFANIIDVSEKETQNIITDNNETTLAPAEKPESMSCGELRDRILANENILIIDTRSQEDFKSSSFKKGYIINIPSSLIKPGTSAAMLRDRLLCDKDKQKWDSRDEYKKIVMFDWHTEEKTPTPGSTLHILKNIFLKWDPGVTYKENPLILEGGYERWLDECPFLTTNHAPQRPQVNNDVPFVPLDKIEYPMADLAESIVPLKPKILLQPVTPTLTDSSVGFHLLTPSSVPVIDRSTKPDPGKPTATPMEAESEEKIPLETETPLDEIRTNTPDVMPNPIPIKKPADKQPTIMKKTEGPSVFTPTSIKEQHRTPPKKAITDEIGDGDNDISSAKLKNDDDMSPGFPSGLKRSRSSPNIAQLKDDADLTRKAKPQIDRTNKPSPISSYADSCSPRSHGNVPRGLTGLKNLGNLCYMNSIMQCVSNTEELKKQLITINNTQYKVNRNSKTKGQVFDAVKQLIFLLHQGAYRWVTCQDLKSVVGQFRNAFAGYEQQDSHEFLTELMDWLHEDLNCPSSNFSLEGACEETGERAWGEFKKKNESIVLELFYGQLRSTITCSECRKQSVTFDPFSNLSLPLPMDKDKCNLSECIRLYLTGEMITGWNCPRCKEPRRAEKKLDITRLPPVLVIHLKRFMTEGLGTGWTRKRPNMVYFPLEDLDMRQYAVNSEQRFHTYNLYAVSNHYGTMDSGHYTAYCKNYSYNKWYKFDDQEVSEISPSVVKSPDAYILFYSTISRS